MRAGQAWPWLAACLAAPPALGALQLEPAFGGRAFTMPVQVLAAPGGELAVVQQDGRVFIGGPRSAELRSFLDVRSKVRVGGEEGFLSLALHPRFAEDGRAYAWYSVAGAKPRRTRLAEYRADAARGRLLPESERVLLEVEKRFGNHNGGCLRFGPDGHLYLGVGDGGGGGDPDGNAQNPATLLGKLLRLDIDRIPAGRRYGIPADNPYARGGGRPEIYALGLRNPWRMSFDPAGWALWVGDVGQDAWEEVDRVVKGGNYGWNWREGSHAFRQGQPPAGLQEPVFEYGRKLGNSVTGGVVLRGPGAGALQGRYLFADFASRRLFSLDADRPAGSFREEGRCPQMPSSLDLDAQGQAWICGYEGSVYRVLAPAL